MSLKIERACDWCQERSAVMLPKSGPLDLSSLGLPDAWASHPPFPGGKVGDQDSQELCEGCSGEYSAVLLEAEAARDAVYTQAMSRAQGRRKAGAATRKNMSSSFAGVR